MTQPGLAEVAAGYTGVILQALAREYPRAVRHVVVDAADLPAPPHEAHPAFTGCQDWHSSVAMQWALVRMLRICPWAVPVTDVRAVLDTRWTTDALATEADYLRDRPDWERPYGRGWVLSLAAELAGWAAEGEDESARRWSAAMAPLADTVADALLAWLPRATYPDRDGKHANSAFALARALPYARVRAAADDPGLLDAISDAAVRWFAADVEYPADWEPGGADFVSPALAEAELIAALGRPPEAFPQWLALFLPGLADGQPDSLLTPAVVADPGDGQGAHLHGLNLHRAYVFGLLAEHLGEGDPRREVLRAAASRHAAASLPAVTGSGWAVEHWLAAYAVLLLGRGVP